MSAETKQAPMAAQRRLMIDMRGLSIQANEGVFNGTVNIMVHDTRVVESLCNKLRKIKGVQKAARCKE